MASFEEIGVAFQLVDQTFRLVRNMRSNANAYIAIANAKGDAGAAALAATMRADAQQFLNRVATISSLATRNLTLLTNALAVFGQTVANANALKTTLNASCNHTLGATLTTAQNCVDEANAILSAVPNYDGIF